MTSLPIHPSSHGATTEKADTLGCPVPTGSRATRSFSEFDSPSFQQLHVTRGPDGLHRVELLLEGVRCGACVATLERLPRSMPGLIEARADLGRSHITLAWDQSRTTLSAIARELNARGYSPHAARGLKERDRRRAIDRAMLIRIGVAGACAGNIMLLFIALYAGLFEGIDPAHAALLRWTALGLTAIAVLGPGWLFFQAAWQSIRARSLTLDAPIALGLGAGLVWGAVNTFRGTSEVYFDSISALVFFLLIGRFLQRRQRGAADSLELLYSLTSSHAHLVEDGSTRDVPIEELRPADHVRVLAGETIPVDAIVVEGQSAIDAAILTGESLAVHVKRDQPVFAGTTNLSAPLLLRVTARGSETRAGAILRLVEQGSREKGALAALADRFAGWFVAGLILLALVTVALWWRTDPRAAINHAVALVIATCPCGIGLATPLTISIAAGRAARAGILIKSGRALEALGRPPARATLILDKTGTITMGRTSVAQAWGDAEVLSLASALAKCSSHHASRAIANAFPAPDNASISDFHETPGAGIEARVLGPTVRLGSPAFVRSASTHEDVSIASHEQDALHLGCSPVLVSLDGCIRAVLAIGDTVREDSRSAVQAMHERGWNVRVLSGDNARTVHRVAQLVGIPIARCTAHASPEDKLDAVREARRFGPVVMVGDGVNDAAALAAADVGIAVHASAEASLQAADVYLSRPGLAPLVELLDGSRRTVRVLWRGILVSLAYNALVAGLAMAGLVSPLVAAVLMPLASFTVLALAAQARTFDGAREPAAASLAAESAPADGALACP
jgi:Cu2+-exporting ATPase